MGFGILLLGYPLILSVTLHSMGFCFELLGYLIMFRALTLLSEYGKYFRYAKYAVSALIPLGAFSLVLQCFSWFGADRLYETVSQVVSVPYSILLAVMLLVFHMLLLLAVKTIAREVDLPKLVTEASRNIIVTWLYVAAVIVSCFLNVPAVTDVLPYYKVLGYVSLFGVIWILLNAKMIFVCYMRICLPEDLDMPVGDRKMPRLFGRPKEEDVTEEELAAAEKAKKEKEKADYDAAMRQRQLERTRKNKRGRKK
ncbi:MAG: hypothetical protein E7604_02710 [Ruminococcaceae bacterium]|nr:hypothetical protein [Oscillospiraceae bacterium]